MKNIYNIFITYKKINKDSVKLRMHVSVDKFSRELDSCQLNFLL